LDGTLTESRTSYKIPLEAFSALRRLLDAGLEVVFVTANALASAAGLARYVGAHAVIAENGCAIARVEPRSPSEVSFECKESLRWLAAHVARELAQELAESWQNDFRRCDFALVPLKPPARKELVEKVKELVEGLGLSSKVSVSSSGYAVHLTPRECSKRKALEKYLLSRGLKLSEALCIGDSAMDAEFVASCGVPVAVANADEEVKSVAAYVTKRPSGYGFSEVVDMLLEARRCCSK